MDRVILSSKNRVVIPGAARQKLDLRSGDQLIIERVTDTELVFRKEPSYYDFIGIAPTQKKDPVLRIRELRDNWK